MVANHDATTDEPTRTNHDRDDGAHDCDAAGRRVIGLGDRDRCPFCWTRRDELAGADR